MNYRTRQDDMLDAICHQHYPGVNPSDAMPKVLAANPGLEQHPPQLPQGLTLALPDIPPPEPEPGIELWS